MPRRRSKGAKALREINQPVNVLQANRVKNPEYQNTLKEVSIKSKATISHGVGGIRSLFDDDEENSQPIPSTSTSGVLRTAALYDELDSFRQRWKRELARPKPSATTTDAPVVTLDNEDTKETHNAPTESSASCSSSSLGHLGHLEQSETDSYAKAKKLFLLAVSLEQDELHHESIRYYKQAMHICPDIERQIFKEQCEANALANANIDKQGSLEDSGHVIANESKLNTDENSTLLTRVQQSLDSDNRTLGYAICRPAIKPKQGCLHISDLPRELVLLIYRYVIGQELDLASLEAASLVCRGFYLLSREASLWRSICYSVWGDNDEDINLKQSQKSKVYTDWRDVFIKKLRVNYDGVYISRTRYIRQGEVGFQDLTYRPFHVVRYYRYLRFLPENRVLILTSNEEPEKIVPIFRHATRAKQFSPELSVLEGTYEFISPNYISIVAEKDCRTLMNSANPTSQRRQAQLNWSRQTPLSQKFNMKFELKTVENRPYRNNVLKWLEYTILTRLEMDQEITSFDLNADTFPSLFFSRVKRFNTRATKPLASH